MQGCCNFFSFLSVCDEILYLTTSRVLCGNDILWHLLTHGLFEGKERSFTLAGFHGGSLTLFWRRFHIFFACSPYCKDLRERCSPIFGQGHFSKNGRQKKPFHCVKSFHTIIGGGRPGIMGWVVYMLRCSARNSSQQFSTGALETSLQLPLESWGVFFIAFFFSTCNLWMH